MSSEAVDAPTRDDEQPEPTTFTLNIVSPSVGVSGPLTFPHLPASTTVQQLKARIRDVIHTRPTDESQRLIHRGRMLANGAETMRDVFGNETLTSPDYQTLHLVLRPAADAPAAAAAAAPTPTPPSLSHVPPPPAQLPPQPHEIPLPAQHPLPGFQHVQHQAQIHHHQTNLQAIMNARLQHLQQEAERINQRISNLDQATGTLGGQPRTSGDHGNVTPNLSGAPANHRPAGVGLPSFQNLIAQNQRDRAAEGFHGAGVHGSLGGIPQPNNLSRANPNMQRPEHSTTYTREGVGPNGERWQITVNETTVTTPIVQVNPQAVQAGAHPALEIQRTLRTADRAMNDRNLQAQVDRTELTAATSSTPRQPDVVSHAGVQSTSTVVNPALVDPPFSSAFETIGVTPSTLVEPMVYILSSPSGPRALLVNNSESFYTPRRNVPTQSRRHGVRAVDEGLQQHIAEALPRNRNDRAARRARRNQDLAREPQIALHGANPGAGALAAQIWPHLWLIVRLLGFIWFFTAGNNSWQRTFLICGLAVVVFVINTGALNGVAENIWGPVRRHVDRLLPLAGPDAALVAAANAAIPQAAPVEVQTHGNGPGTQLNPADVAARLLEQQRQRNWFMTQVRRVEHAMLLFLASLVPGVGERHIAAREAEAAAAEQRRIAAASATEADSEQNSDGLVPGMEREERAAETGENQGEQPPPLVDI